MTDRQRRQIEHLRREGMGYKVIANATDLSRDSVRQYCRLHGLAGYGRCIAAMQAAEEDGES